jgi:hypothetical protein
MNPGTSDNSRVGVAAVIGGLVLLAAIALGLIANAVNNGGPPTPCLTCTPRPIHATATPVYPTEVPTFPAPVPSQEVTAQPTVEPPTEVPTVPAPVPTDVPTAQPTAPEPVPTKGP